MLIAYNPSSIAEPGALQNILAGVVAIDSETGEKLYRSRGRSRSGTGKTYWVSRMRLKAHSDEEAIEIANKRLAKRRAAAARQRRRGGGGVNNQLTASLRVCASCEWIFRTKDSEWVGCPKCGFAHYGARFVFGNQAYRYAKTQKPWYDRKMTEYALRLRDEITQAA